MKFYHKVSVLSSFILMLSNISQVNAAGYSSDLYSASGLANAYAGSVTGVHDASDLFYNPALSVNFKKSQLVISASYIDLDIDSDGANGQFANGLIVSGNDGGDGGQDGFVPALYFSTPINEDLAFGLSINSPFGLATKYDKNWTGRYHAIESSISTLNINPSLSYKINQKLSVGAGIQAQYYKSTLTKAVFTGGNDAFAKLDGSDWGYGYNLGLNYEFNDRLEFGLGYRSKIDHKINGRTRVAELGLFSDFDAKTTTPESVTVGFNYKANDKLEIAYDTTWVRWSRLNSLVANARNPVLNDSIEFQWKDSLIYSLGLNYNLNDKWLLRSGLAYEKDAVRDAGREPRVPTGDRIWTTFGFNYKISNNTSVDLSYVRQFYTTQNITISDSTNTLNDLNLNTKTTVNVYSIGIKQEF